MVVGATRRFPTPAQGEHRAKQQRRDMDPQPPRSSSDSNIKFQEWTQTKTHKSGAADPQQLWCGRSVRCLARISAALFGFVRVFWRSHSDQVTSAPAGADATKTPLERKPATQNKTGPSPKTRIHSWPFDTMTRAGKPLSASPPSSRGWLRNSSGLSKGEGAAWVPP